MKYRKLRIAWSVAWGIAGVLLVVLWVRSYTWGDNLMVALTTSSAFRFASGEGVLLMHVDEPPKRKVRWHLMHIPLSQWRQMKERLVRAGGPTQFANAVNRWGLNGHLMRAPHWFFALITLVIAAGSWLNLLRRYSLRTLLIGITVLAALLGLVVWAVR